MQQPAADGGQELFFADVDVDGVLDVAGEGVFLAVAAAVGEERQLGIMRRWLASLLPENPARDDLTTIATELATNADFH